MAVNAQQLEKEGIYEGKLPIAALLADLDQIGVIVHNAEACKKKQKKLAMYLAIGGLFGSMAGFVLLPLLVLTIPAAIGGIIWAFYLLAVTGKLLEHPKRMEFAKERLTTILPDAKPDKPFSLRLSLSSKPVQLSQGAWHGRKNGKQEFLEETWFSLEGPLLDGTELIDEIKELKRVRTFSNPRGKHKTKSRITHLVNVRFCYPTTRYGDARPAEQALRGKTKLCPGATLRSVRCTEKAIALKALVSTDQAIAQTAGMLSMGGYRILNLARRMAARQSGPQGENAS